MDPNIVDPGTRLVNLVPFLLRHPKQPDFTSGQAIPQQCHKQRVVADLTFDSVNIFGYIIEMDNGFTLEY